MFIILLLTTRGLLNSLICTAHFSNDFNVVYSVKKKINLLCFCSIACKTKKKRINIKNILF